MSERANQLPTGPANFERKLPAGDNRARLVCTTCGYIAYENPKIVAGSVVRSGGRYLLCRRDIEPRRGFWTLPAGYLELNETPEEGALREAREEACAELQLDGLLAVFSIRRLSQVQLIFRATLLGSCAAGPETQEVTLVPWDAIPWEEIAFPSVRWALNADRNAGEDRPFAPVRNPPGEDGDLL